MFHLKNGSYLPLWSFLMKLFLLPTERTNKIIKSKYFDQCVGSVLVVCRPTRWPTCWWDRILQLLGIAHLHVESTQLNTCELFLKEK